MVRYVYKPIRDDHIHTASFVKIGGDIPYDGSPIEVIDSTHIAFTAIFFTLASLGLICTLVCLVFNIAFRNKRYIHVTAPTHSSTLSTTS